MNRFIPIIPLLLVMGSNLRASNETGAWTLDLSGCESDVEFHAIGLPDLVHILGSAKSGPVSPLAGDLKFIKGSVSGKASFLLEACDTDFPLRDEQIKTSCLEVNRWPRAELTLTDLKLPPGFEKVSFSARSIPFRGELFLHGVKGPTQGHCDIDCKNNSIEMKFDFEVGLREHAIPPQKYLGLSVENEVKVEVSVKGHLKPLPPEIGAAY